MKIQMRSVHLLRPALFAIAIVFIFVSKSHSFSGPSLVELPFSDSLLLNKIGLFGNTFQQEIKTGGALEGLSQNLLVRVGAPKFVNGALDLSSSCTGILIGHRAVLTARHCVIIRRLDQNHRVQESVLPGLQVRSKLNNHEIDTLVTDVEPLTFDTVLLRLKEIPSSELEHIHYAELATSPCDSDSFIYSVGFGITENGKSAAEPRVTRYNNWEADGDVTGNLGINQHRNQQRVDSKIKKARSLEEVWSSLPLAAGRVCPGDSGGPVFCKSRGRLVLAGILSSLLVNHHHKKPSAVTSQFMAANSFQMHRLPTHLLCRLLSGMIYSKIRDVPPSTLEYLLKAFDEVDDSSLRP